VIRMLASSKRLLAALLTLAAVARCAQQEVRERPFHRIQLPPRVGPPQADAAVQRRAGPGLYGPPVPAGTLSHPDLRYRILDYFGHIWFCDPHAFFAERSWERSEALQALPLIQNDNATYRSIAEHLGLKTTGGELSDEQTVAVYRQYKELQAAVRLDANGEKFRFAIAVKTNDEDRAIEGDIDRFGQITIAKNEPTFLACQICPPASTLMETPNGSIPIWDLKPGMPIWTLNVKGERVVAPILKISKMPVSPEHRMVHLMLADGRDVWTSPGRFYGASDEQTQTVPHEGETCDVLPAGDTGLYSGVSLSVAPFGDSTLIMPKTAK